MTGKAAIVRRPPLGAQAGVAVARTAKSTLLRDVTVTSMGTTAVLVLGAVAGGVTATSKTGLAVKLALPRAGATGSAALAKVSRASETKLALPRIGMETKPGVH